LLGVTAEALRANIGLKSAISLQRGQFDSKFQVEWVALHQSFLQGYVGQCMPYNFVADSFHTKEFCIRLLRAKCNFTPKITVLRF